MKSAEIHRVSGPVPLLGDTEGTVWENSDLIPINQFLWTSPEQQPQTSARALYSDQSLFLHYSVVDRHSYAEATMLNGKVWEDSCVEFFANPIPETHDAYFNFEVNCVGTFHLGYGTSRTDRTLVDPELADDIRVRGSINGPTKQPQADDERWWTAVEIPFDTLSKLAGIQSNPSPRTRWQGNFYRIQSCPEPLYVAWNPVKAQDPDFHRPSEFGDLLFQK